MPEYLCATIDETNKKNCYRKKKQLHCEVTCGASQVEGNRRFPCIMNIVIWNSQRKTRRITNKTKKDVVVSVGADGKRVSSSKCYASFWLSNSHFPFQICNWIVRQAKSNEFVMLFAEWLYVVFLIRLELHLNTGRWRDSAALKMSIKNFLNT